MNVHIRSQSPGHILEQTPGVFACLLAVPQTRYETRGDCAFQAVSPYLWNALPPSLRSLGCRDIFTKRLKAVLFRQAFGYLCE